MTRECGVSVNPPKHFSVRQHFIESKIWKCNSKRKKKVETQTPFMPYMYSALVCAFSSRLSAYYKDAVRHSVACSIYKCELLHTHFAWAACANGVRRIISTLKLLKKNSNVGAR